ncbi:unnamed protein product [Rotaria sp. Silwood1]|nr:unnamed protein product [Rotaria sp. Silwood1]CAF4874688.1 unnamed protein product [Rotaria sp. Silwood1]
MAECLKSESDTIQLISPVISFINSQKGKLMLVLDDDIFKLNRQSKTTKYWICIINGCLSKVRTTLDNQLIEFIDKHNHPSEKEKIEIRRFREKVKERAVNETTPIPQIYEEECAKMMLSFAAITILPSEREMNSSLNKARRAITPSIPTTQIFDIPEPFNKTLRNSDFVIVDKMIARQQRILLFASNEQLKMLFNAETILMDGTFSSCPTMFDQVYTIHSIKFDQSFPCVFGLLPNRLKPTYTFMVQELKSLAEQMQLQFTPKKIMTDFESGLMSVLKTEFPSASYSSCYFHLTQAIYRAIQRFGLSTNYNNDDDVRRACRQLMALALLPTMIIESTYDQLLSTMATHLKNTLNGLFKYFEEQWFVKVPIPQWCVHGLTFHSRFNRRVQVHHPNIWSFIKVLQGEENRFEHMCIQFYAGLGPRVKQPRTISIQRRIDNLNMRYNDGLITPMEYLDGLSFVVAKKKK